MHLILKLLRLLWLLAVVGPCEISALGVSLTYIPQAAVSCSFKYDVAAKPGYDGSVFLTFGYDRSPIPTTNICTGQFASTATTFGQFAELLAAEGGIQTLDASAIRFSQSSVNGAGEIVNSMAANGWQGGPVTVVRMADGGLTTVDNTRVLAAGLTGTPVQATIMDAGAAIDASQAIRFV